MKAKDALVGIGGIIIIVGLMVVGLLLFSLFIWGAEWVSTKLLPWFSVITWISFALVIFVVLPLAIPRATRGFSSVALLIASYVFGATLWMWGFLLTLATWGGIAVFIGLAIAGVGVVPIAMLATLFKGMWQPLIELVLLTVMTFGSRAGAISLAGTLDRT